MQWSSAEFIITKMESHVSCYLVTIKWNLTNSEILQTFDVCMRIKVIHACMYMYKWAQISIPIFSFSYIVGESGKGRGYKPMLLRLVCECWTPMSEMDMLISSKISKYLEIPWICQHECRTWVQKDKKKNIKGYRLWSMCITFLPYLTTKENKA